MMEHNMNLHPGPYAMIATGQKTIELRLYDEKRQKIRVGDSILFTNTETGEQIRTTVAQIHRFGSFAELYQALPLLQCGYTPENVDKASPADMNSYYSPEQQAQYGVLGIELQL